MNSNLDAYHTQDKLMDLQIEIFSQRMTNAKTDDERKQILKESDEYFEHQKRIYSQLANEMGQIMLKIEGGEMKDILFIIAVWLSGVLLGAVIGYLMWQ